MNKVHNEEFEPIAATAIEIPVLFVSSLAREAQALLKNFEAVYPPKHGGFIGQTEKEKDETLFSDCIKGQRVLYRVWNTGFKHAISIRQAMFRKVLEQNGVFVFVFSYNHASSLEHVIGTFLTEVHQVCKQHATKKPNYFLAVSVEMSTLTKTQVIAARKKIQQYSVLSNKICIEYNLKTLMNVKQILYEVFKHYAKQHSIIHSNTTSLDESRTTIQSNQSTEEPSERTDVLEAKSLVKSNMLNIKKASTTEQESSNLVVNLLWNRLFKPVKKPAAKYEKPQTPKRPLQLKLIPDIQTNSNDVTPKEILLSIHGTEKTMHFSHLEDPTENDAYLETTGDDEWSQDSLGSQNGLSDCETVDDAKEVTGEKTGIKDEDDSERSLSDDQFTFKSSCGELTEHVEDLESTIKS